MMIFAGGVKVIRTLVILLRLHPLVTHLFAAFNHLLLALGFLILVRLIMLPVIKVFSLLSPHLVSYPV
jgi:hypothetical protein